MKETDEHRRLKEEGRYPGDETEVEMTGLSSEEAARLLKSHGLNAITEQKPRSPFVILLHQLNSPMMYLLAFAVAVSYAFGEWLDGSAIAIVLVLNIMIGFWMEYQAARSMEALKKLVTLPARVVRDYRMQEIISEEVVPGDLLYVKAGDMIAADAELVKSAELQTDEATLTGESLPVSKHIEKNAVDTSFAERRNLLFKGTFVTRGNGFAVVQTTGMQTQLGKIAHLVQEAQPSATPLEKKLEVFSRKLVWITMGLLAIILCVGLYQQTHILELFKTAIALAVAAIPEGLPIVATLALARGMLKMAKYKVIIKKLSAVETLGGTDVICTDKTGTLTQNRIEVRNILYPGGGMEVEQMSDSGIVYSTGAGMSDAGDFEKLLEIAVLCNTADYVKTEDEYSIIGDPIEAGLVRFALASHVDVEGLRRDNVMERQIPFSSERKMMTTRHRRGPGQWIAAKGAVEEILDHCTYLRDHGQIEPLSNVQRHAWLRQGELLAEKGLRVLGFASKEEDKEDMDAHLVFVGIIGFMDPPVEGIKEALDECRNAGIDVKLITGDHPATARTIATTLGLVEEDNTEVILGKEMKRVDQLSVAERQRWKDTHIFARVSPAQKLDLVTVLQDEGHIVGMTGDGINDAPALKKADIGIAMGVRGTQVAQEAAVMVLKNDAFTSIVRAIKQGRIIFENIRKFVVYLLSSNLSELMVIVTAALLNLHFQLLPLQILFMNLISDVLPALALGMSKGSGDVMLRQPRNPDEPILSSRKWTTIWVYAGVMALCTLSGVWVHHNLLHPGDAFDPHFSNNILFLSLVGAQLLHVFNMSESAYFFRGEEFTNKYVWWSLLTNACIVYVAYSIPQIKEALYLGPLTFIDIMVIAGATIASFLINRLLKMLKWVT